MPHTGLRFGEVRADAGRPLGGGRAPRGCRVLRPDSPGARGPGHGPRRTFVMQMLKALRVEMKSTEKSFPPLLGYSLQFTQEVSGVCVPSATSWAPLHRSEEPNVSSWARSSPADETSGSSMQDRHRPPKGREWGSSRPPRAAIAAAPLYSTLGGGPRPSREAAVPGGRPGARRASQPTFAPGRRVQNESPERERRV